MQGTQQWELARCLYSRERTWLVIGFLARSLPEAFAASKGAAVLHPSAAGLNLDGIDPHQRTSTLRGDSAWRTRRTLDFIDALFDWKDPSGNRKQNFYAGEDPIGVVRRRHSRVRGLIEHPPAGAIGTWNAMEFGRPVNQEDLLGTVCTFVAPVREMFDIHLPDRVSGAEWDAWAAVWCEIGCRLGLDPRYVTIKDGQTARYFDAAELGAVAGVIRDRQRERSVAGVQLMSNLMEDLKDALPRPIAALALAGVVAFGDPELNRILVVPPTFLGSVAGVVSRLLARVPTARRLFPAISTPVTNWALAALDRVSAEPIGDLTSTFPATCSSCESGR